MLLPAAVVGVVEWLDGRGLVEEEEEEVEGVEEVEEEEVE